MALPVITTAQDVLDIVEYLKTKPTGATLAEAQAVVKKQILDGRKQSAYVTWGIIAKEGDRLSLTNRGWELARSRDGGTVVFRAVLDSLVPYRSALEWMHHQNFDTVTNVDVAAQWHQHHSEALGTTNENTIKDNAVCFFNICQAAGFGKLTLGRKGSPTRLTIDKDELRAHIQAGPSAPPWEGSLKDDEPDPTEDTIHEQAEDKDGERDEVTPLRVVVSQKLRIFISHGGGMEMVDQVQTMLGLADMEGEVAEKEETTAIPVPEKVFAAMRRCNAGIIVVSVDETNKDSDGKYALNDNVLIEIGAAFVLYDRRVVLLWDKRLQVPSNLQGLYRCEFEGSELSWDAGMKLMKAIQKFKLAEVVEAAAS
jgi:hypothetical protein